MTNLIFLKMDIGHFLFSDPPRRALMLDLKGKQVVVLHV